MDRRLWTRHTKNRNSPRVSTAGEGLLGGACEFARRASNVGAMSAPAAKTFRLKGEILKSLQRRLSEVGFTAENLRRWINPNCAGSIHEIELIFDYPGPSMLVFVVIHCSQQDQIDAGQRALNLWQPCCSGAI